MSNNSDIGYDEIIDNKIFEKQRKEHEKMKKEKVEEITYGVVWDTLRKVDTSKVEYKKQS